MLSQRYSSQHVQGALLPRPHWHPFPTAAERAAWAAFPATLRQAHVERGEKLLGCPWPALPATLYLEFARIGNRRNYEQPWFARRNALCDLALAECIEGQGRFLDDLANGIWALCEESSWVLPAHVAAQQAGVGLPDVGEPVVDLFAAETAALLAWILYLLAPELDRVSPLLAPRLEREIQARLLIPLFTRTDFWWMGFAGNSVNNWNPWIVSNWLVAALVVERDETRRCRHLLKAMRTLDHFIDPYPADGGCDEGPSYWGRAGASLYECLEWLRSATDGAVDIYREPLIQNIGKFIYRVQAADRYFINFADAPAMLTPSPSVCFGFGKRIGDPELQAIGAWAAAEHNVRHRGLTDSIGRQLATLSIADELLATAPRAPLPRDVFLPNIELFAARDQAGATAGFFVAAKGGHNAESHNHNDVGHFVVYLDGRPLLVDAGVETYTAKTFSPERYSIWTMQSAFHSLPTINGVQQAPGHIFKARNVSWQADDHQAEFQLDLAEAWPPEAGVKCWERTITLIRGQEIVVADRFELAAPARELTLNILTAAAPELVEPGRLALRAAALSSDRHSAAATLHYDASQLEPTIEPIPLADPNLQATWGKQLTRLVLAARHPAAKGEWKLRLTRLAPPNPT